MRLASLPCAEANAEISQKKYITTAELAENETPRSGRNRALVDGNGPSLFFLVHLHHKYVVLQLPELLRAARAGQLAVAGQVVGRVGLGRGG